MAENYIMGGGEAYFAPFLPGTKTLPAGGAFRFMGNIPTFSLNITSEKYEHFRSTRGIREKDLTVPLQTNRSGSLVLEDIIPANMALFFLGSTLAITQAAATAQTESFVVKKGFQYQIGITPNNPTGARGVTALVLTKGGTALVAGIDYVYDGPRGFFQILETSTVITTNADTVTANFSLSAVTRNQTISGATSASGALRFISYPAVGTPLDYFLPYVEFTPNGDFNLISSEAVQQMPVTVDVQTLGNLAAVYLDGQAVASV